MRYRKSLRPVLLLGAVALLTACGKKEVSEEKSPQLVGGEISSYNEGTVDSQFVRADLVFDKKISVADSKDSLRITISGERIGEDEYTLQMGDAEDTASLIILVEAVTKGVLKIQKSEKVDTISDIMDDSGTYAVKDFTLEGIIPSGLSLSTVKSGNGEVVKQVDSPWNIRSIAWVALSQDGALAPMSETQESELLDGYAAVHGHEFLMEDEKDIAEKIRETLENNYGAEYRFACDGQTVTAQRVDEVGELDIVVYQYLRIDGKEIDSELDGEFSAAAVYESVEDHESGIKIKTPVIDRDISQDEQDFKDGKELYMTVIITGEAMPEERIYSVHDLETLIQQSFQNQSLYSFGLPLAKGGYYGVNLPAFLELCGIDREQDGLSVLFRDKKGEGQTYSTDGWTVGGTGHAGSWR